MCTRINGVSLTAGGQALTGTLATVAVGLYCFGGRRSVQKKMQDVSKQWFKTVGINCSKDIR